MRPLTEIEYQAMLEERKVIVPALNHPGVQLLMKKLNDQAVKSTAALKTVNVIDQQYKAIYHQVVIDLCEGEIPRIIENIVNVGTTQPWSFRKWLKDLMKKKPA